MSSSETTDQGQWHRRLAVWLVAAHLVVGLLLGGITRWSVEALSYSDYAVFVLAGFVFAQACLLGTWAAFGSSPPVVRLTGVMVGVAYLGSLFGFCIDELETEIVIMVASASVSVACLLVVARYTGVELVPGGGYDSTRPGTQFSIRQLLIVTMLIACSLAIGRWVWPEVDVENLVTGLLISGPFATIGLVAACAILGTKYSWLGLILPFGLAFPAAYGLAWISGTRDEPGIWATATLTEALTLAVTLGVLRSRGFRLRRQRR